MQLGPIIITRNEDQEALKAQLIKQGESNATEQVEALNKKLTDIQNYVADELTKFHESQNEPTVVEKLNKNLSNVGSPYAYLYANAGKSKEDKTEARKIDLETLRFWSSELPNAPQAREYLVNAIFSRGYKLVLNEGKTENLVLKNKIEAFIAKANSNGTSLIDILKAVIDNSLVGGDGYIEKVKNKKKTRLAEVYNVDPINVICIKDEKAAAKGVLKVIKYAKVENINASDRKDKKFDVKDIPTDAYLELDEIIHWKNRDNGDAYGHSDLEQNQETTKLIINILNQNSKRFNNEIIHSLWIDLGANADWPQANLFLAQYKANYLGKNNFGKPLVTYGDIKVVKWDNPMKDFDYMAFMEKFAKAHAPSLYGVAISEIDNSGATYNNAEQGHKTTILHEVYPLQSRVEMIMNHNIIPEIEGLYPNPENEDLDLTATYKMQLERENIFTMYTYIIGLVNALLSAAINIDEFRMLLDSSNLPPIGKAFAKEYMIKLGNSVSVLSQEFFAGTDEEMDEETKNKKLTNGQELYGRIEAFTAKKKQ